MLQCSSLSPPAIGLQAVGIHAYTHVARLGNVWPVWTPNVGPHFEEVWTPNAEFCYHTPYGHPRTMQGVCVQLTKVVLGPVSEVLLTRAATQVKMRLVTEQHKTSRGSVVGFPNNSLRVSKFLSLSSCANIILYGCICSSS